jgi:hypothetical protein
LQAVGTTVLYRPLGRRELELIREGGFRAFPPLPPGQSIFKAALTRDYAAEVARNWSAKEKTPAYSDVYVVRFEVDSAYLSRYSPHQVAGSRHREYSIPADGLNEFNGHIRGLIELVAEYHDPGVPDDAA